MNSVSLRKLGCIFENIFNVRFNYTFLITCTRNKGFTDPLIIFKVPILKIISILKFSSFKTQHTVYEFNNKQNINPYKIHAVMQDET